MAGDVNINPFMNNAWNPTMGTKRQATGPVPTTPPQAMNNNLPLLSAIQGPAIQPQGTAPLNPNSPIGNVSFPGARPAAGPAPAGNSMSGRDLAMGGISAAADGLGQVLQEDAARKQLANQNNQPLFQNQAHLIQRQGENRTNQADSLLRQTPAGSDIEPFANMALRRALMGSFTPQTITPPPGVQMGQLSGGFDMTALKPVMDKYFSDEAIKASMQQQQAMRVAVDPWSMPSGAGDAIFGEGYNTGAIQDYQADRQHSQLGFENQSREALAEAIRQNNANGKGSSVWKKVGAMALKAAPYVAAPFTAGASLAFAPAANSIANNITK